MGTDNNDDLKLKNLPLDSESAAARLENLKEEKKDDIKDAQRFAGVDNDKKRVEDMVTGAKEKHKNLVRFEEELAKKQAASKSAKMDETAALEKEATELEKDVMPESVAIALKAEMDRLSAMRDQALAQHQQAIGAIAGIKRTLDILSNQKAVITVEN